MFKEPCRARRIRHTRRIAARRHYDFIHRMNDGDSSTSPWAMASSNYGAKTSIGRCSCAKKRHGTPRRDIGMCDRGARNRIYWMRVQVRRLNHLVHRGVDLEGDEVALLFANGGARL